MAGMGDSVKIPSEPWKWGLGEPGDTGGATAALRQRRRHALTVGCGSCITHSQSNASERFERVDT